MSLGTIRTHTLPLDDDGGRSDEPSGAPGAARLAEAKRYLREYHGSVKILVQEAETWAEITEGAVMMIEGTVIRTYGNESWEPEESEDGHKIWVWFVLLLDKERFASAGHDGTSGRNAAANLRHCSATSSMGTLRWPQRVRLGASIRRGCGGQSPC